MQEQRCRKASKSSPARIVQQCTIKINDRYFTCKSEGQNSAYRYRHKTCLKGQVFVSGVFCYTTGKVDLSNNLSL